MEGRGQDEDQEQVKLRQEQEQEQRESGIRGAGAGSDLERQLSHADEILCDLRKALLAFVHKEVGPVPAQP
eukprot:33187-Hanusia_phi.AAC.1